MPQNKNKKFVFLSLFLAFFVLANTALASQALDGLNSSAGKGYNNNPGDVSNLVTNIPQKIGQIVGVALSLVGVMFLVLMIYGGFTWMMARGNEQDVEKAKRLIEAAVVGLIIVMSAYAITSFIGANVI